MCKNINILSYSTTVNAIEFDLSVFAIIPILFTRHIVSHSFINFIFCCFENVSAKIVENSLRNYLVVKWLGTEPCTLY